MGDVTFDGYVITTTNPGNALLIATFTFCILCFLVSCLLSLETPLDFLTRKVLGITGNDNDANNGAKQLNSDQSIIETGTESTYRLQEDARFDAGLKPKKKKCQKKKRYGGIQSTESMKKIIKVQGLKRRPKKILNESPKNREDKGKKAKIKVYRTSTRIGRYEEKLHFEDFKFFWRSDSKASLSDGTFRGKTIYTKNSSVDEQSVITECQSVDSEEDTISSENEYSVDSNGNYVVLNKEMRKMVGLAAPWMMQSFVTEIADIIYMMLISHFLGLGELICYSIVWYILSLAQFLTYAWGSSVYKHMVAALGQETKEGDVLAGKYLRIGVVGKILLMIPSSILITLLMPSIMEWIGYDEEVVNVSQSIAAVSCIIEIVDSCGETFSSLLEIQGYARFNAVYDFWEVSIDLLLGFIFISLVRPDLLSLTIFNLLLSIASNAYYTHITIRKHSLFESYKQGYIHPIEKKMLPAIKSMAKEAIPFAYLSVAGYIEDILFALFASYQGAAETATWVLLGHLWAVIETVPECLASAATVRVEHNLSRGNLNTSKTISNRTIVICSVTSVFFSLLLLDCRRYLAWCLSLDETLETMILEIIPYIAMCQPFVTSGLTAEYLNEVLGKYKQSVAISTVIDMCFTLPIAAIFTYVLNYNIEGLASASCMGYALCGITNIFIYSNTNWEYAAKKIQGYVEEI